MTCLPARPGWWDAKISSAIRVLPAISFAPTIATAITEAMNAWLATRTTEQAIAELEKARVPAGPVLDLQQVLDDPQVKARELLRYVEHPGAARPVPLADTAVRLSATPGGIRRRAAALGEHTDEVLREIGYRDDEIVDLRAGKVV